MASFNSVGLSKDDITDLCDAIAVQIANPGEKSQLDLDNLEYLCKIFTDLKSRIAAYDTANSTDTNPAVIIKSAASQF